MFFRYANSTDRTIIDRLGGNLHRNRFPLGALLHRLRNSDSELLRAEGLKIAACGQFYAVTNLANSDVVRRSICGSALCPVCGLRSTSDKVARLRTGLQHYRDGDVPLYFVTISPPTEKGVSPSEVIRSVKKMLAPYFRELREAVSVDWHAEIELCASGDDVRGHVHCLIAVSDKQTRRSFAPPIFRGSDLGSRSCQLSRSETEHLLHAVGIATLTRLFPDHAHTYDCEETAKRIVNVVPVDDDPKSPSKLASYVTKSLRCGLTPFGLLDASDTLLEALLLAVKPPGRKRATRMSQSAKGSMFSRRPATRKTTRVVSGKPRQKQAPGLSRQRLDQEITDFLAGRMEPRRAPEWARTTGLALQTALENDGDPRAWHLRWAILCVHRRLLDPPSVAVPQAPAAGCG